MLIVFSKIGFGKNQKYKYILSLLRQDGVLLYNGPMGDPKQDVLNYNDYLLIYIEQGMLHAVLQFNGKEPVRNII